MSLATRLLPVFMAGMFVHASPPSHGEALMAAVAADSTSNTGIEMQELEGPDMAGSIPRTGLVDGDWRDMVGTFSERRKWLKLAQSDFDGSSTPVDDRPLSASDIREVQRLLLELGFDPGPIDGKSGPSTAAAISAYQKTEGLPVNGRPSQGLLLNLREVAHGRKATPVLKSDKDVPPGKKEDAAPADTAKVQESGGPSLVGSAWRFLAGLMLRTGLVDGDWRVGAGTLDERREWQNVAQSDADEGSMPVDDRPLSASDIREVQQLLLELGFDPGPIDGKSGPSTAAAISAYQKTEGLPVNGRPSQGLLLNLREVAHGRKATPALKPDEDVPPAKKEDAAPAGTAKMQESGGLSLVGSAWRFKDGSGSEFTLRFEKGGAVGGVLYEKFWSWRHRGNDIEILYDNDLGSRVTRVGAMKTEDLMEGTAVSSRGGGWTWKADRIHPPIKETEETGAAPNSAGQPPADSTTSNDSGMSDVAAPSSPDNAPEASSAPHEQESMPTDEEKQPVPTDGQPQKPDAEPPATSSSRSGETSASERELSGAGPPSASVPSLLTADSRPGGAGPLTEKEKAPDGGVETASREPRIYGIENNDSRIVIRAIDDCWIEVTDANGKTLFSRVLRDGESYRAPAIKGAKMITGNAGGLEILVDGVPIEFSGTEGVVRRDIRLDPDLLKSGDAW